MSNFKVKELVSEYTYSLHGEKAIQLIDRELIKFLDFFHGFCANHFGGKCSMIINDWSWRKGGFQYRGLRDVKYYGAADKFDKSRSRHKVGMCADFDVYINGQRIAPDVIRKLIIDNYQRLGFENIRFIEEGVNWVHISTEATEGDLLIVWHVESGDSVTYPRAF
ncbi:hypothetical protein NVP1029O_71 [Vibrio phage 1.029.O._10N.261.55.A7]|nr:hypothetical protein NVP1029O_71 [Vibrio phage 1.029.O._10N.261.55.A7]